MPKPLDRRLRNRERDAKRRQEKPWRALYNQRWKALRLTQLMREPLSKRCADRGVVRAATVAHHKVAHKGDEQLFFDAGNIASSCADCLRHCKVKPSHSNAWGGVWMRAIKDGTHIMRAVMTVQPCMSDPAKHKHNYSVYESGLFYARKSA